MFPALAGRFFNTAAAAAAKSPQSCPTLCDPIDGSPPGSPIPGILQARTLEWVAMSFSNAWKWTGKVKSLSRARLLATPWTAAYQAPPSIFPGKSTGVRCHWATSKASRFHYLKLLLQNAQGSHTASKSKLLLKHKWNWNSYLWFSRLILFPQYCYLKRYAIS